MKKDYSKHVACLRQVLGILKRDDRRYVCHAIRDTRSSTRVKDELRSWVMQLLGGRSSLENWLSRKCEIYVFSRPDYKKRMRELRIRWVKWMIKELSK